jgi:hypothetical protein
MQVGTLPTEHPHQHHREANRDPRREARQQPSHQRRAGDQLGTAEQDHGGVEQPEVVQQKGDQVIGAEQCAGHRTLELVCYPGGRVRVELFRAIDEAARASTPVDEALDEPHREQRDRHAPVPPAERRWPQASSFAQPGPLNTCEFCQPEFA